MDFTPDAVVYHPYWYARKKKGSETGEIEWVKSSRRRSFHSEMDTAYGVRLNALDGGGEYLRGLARDFPKEFDRALKSAGYQLRVKMLAALRAGGSRSARWAVMSGVKDFEESSVPRGRRLKHTRSRAFYGLMGRAGGKAGKSPIAYHVDKGQGKLTVGWMGFQARRIAARLQAGFRISVSTKMRKHFFASGLSLLKSSIDVPGRPLVEPVWQDEGPDVLRRLELRIHAYVRGYNGKAATQYVRDNL